MIYCSTKRCTLDATVRKKVKNPLKKYIKLKEISKNKNFDFPYPSYLWKSNGNKNSFGSFFGHPCLLSSKDPYLAHCLFSS